MKKAFICPIIFGIIMILIGIYIKIPGGVLTTYSILDGDRAEDYAFGDRYTAIDEYVGGDAYNYEIGASLVSGRISGAITAKSIFIVGGFICICFGMTMIVFIGARNDQFTKIEATYHE